FSALEKRAAELESAGEELGRELALVQQAARGLEGDKAELTSEIVAARAEAANLESQLAQDCQRPSAERGQPDSRRSCQQRRQADCGIAIRRCAHAGK